MPFQPTTLGKFYLYEKLAVGGMAEIFKAKLYGVAGFEKTLVVKLILPEYANDEEFVKMFIDEANIAVSLNHGNIVPVYELGQIGDRYYMAMEFVDGENLETIIERWQSTGNQALPLWHSVFIAHEVCKGLDFAHKKSGADGSSLNIVHRDVSPQNVMISFDGEVKIVDFGIAKAASKLSMTRVGTIKGKFEYMSPEQAYGDDVDGRADVYSLGIVLWEMITGKPLFTGENEIELLRSVREGKIPSVRSVNSQVPPELERAINRALSREPNDRFPDASQFQAALARLLYGEGGLAGEGPLSDFVRALFERRRAPKPSNASARIDGKPAKSQHPDERTVSFAVSEMFAEQTSAGRRIPARGPVPGGASAELTAPAQRAVPAEPPSSVATAAADDSPELVHFDDDETEDVDERTLRMEVADVTAVAVSGTDLGAIPREQGNVEETTNRHVSLSDLLEPEPPPAAAREAAPAEGGIESIEDILDEETGKQRLKKATQAPVVDPEPASKESVATTAMPARERSRVVFVLPIFLVIAGLAVAGWVFRDRIRAFQISLRPTATTTKPPPRTETPTKTVATTASTTPSRAPTRPATVAPPTARKLTFDSVPSGAIVVVNRRNVGKTPLRSLNVPGDKAVTIAVKHRGYFTWIKTIPAGRQDLNLPVVRLKRRPTPAPTAKPEGEGTLVLNADPWATVFIDGVKKGGTPILGLKLSAGVHTIKLVNSELGVTKVFKVVIKKDQEERRIVDMTKRDGPG